MQYHVGKVSVKSMVISTNKISLTFDDTEKMEKIGVSVPNAKEGGISHISPGASMDCTVQEAGKNHIVYTEAEARQLHTENGVWTEDNQMSSADFISRCTTGEDAKGLSEEQTPLEEYTSSQLDRAVTRVKEERRNKQDAVEQQVSKEREEAEATRQAAVKLAAEGQVSPSVLEQMVRSDLPVTPENVARLSHAIDMAAEIGSFSEASMKFFIDSEYHITPENISGSSNYTKGLEGQKKTAEKDDFSLIQSQVQEIMVEDGLEPDEETMQTAQWLYDNDLPVTTENIRLCKQIEELKKEKPDVIAVRITDQMAEGVIPEKANLVKISVAEAITAKRRLEETRLTMTVDALRNMSAKGIDLDISNLEHMVEELRQQEKQARESLLQETELPVTEENARVMGDTLEAARNVLAAPVEFLGRMWESQETDTLASVAGQAKTFTAEFQRVEESYEAVGTEVRRDLGDSMAKAFGNVDAILEDMGLDATGKNQRAIRALAYNQMPLTEENVVRMKDYDSRVTTLMQELKPQVVAELIRREINPLEVSLEELREQVERIREEGDVEDLSFRKYLWKMDHNKEITPEERESMIGVYRLLHQIEKSDGAVIGQVMKEGRELSLSSLLSAVRTRKDAGLDIQVDDDFGGLEDIVPSSNSISDQIRAAYGQTLAGEVKKNLSPELLHQYMEKGADLTLEQLLEACESEGAAEEKSYYENRAAEIRSLAEESEQGVLDFLATLDMPETLANIQMVQAHWQSGAKLFRQLWKKEESEDALEQLEDPENISSVLEEIDENHRNQLAKAAQSDDINYETFRLQSLLRNSISFHGKMREYQMFEIPVFTEKGITNCSVTIRDGRAGEKGSVEIAMDSEEFGKLQATFKVRGTRVNGFVTVEQEEFLPLCHERMEYFEKELEENGFTMDGGSPVAGSRTSLHVGNRAEGAKNKDLYQIAKMFVVSMNRKDDEV